MVHLLPETKYRRSIAKISKLSENFMMITFSDHAHGSNEGKLGLLGSLQNLKPTSGVVAIVVTLQVNVEVWGKLY